MVEKEVTKQLQALQRPLRPRTPSHSPPRRVSPPGRVIPSRAPLLLEQVALRAPPPRDAQSVLQRAARKIQGAAQAARRAAEMTGSANMAFNTLAEQLESTVDDLDAAARDTR